MTATPIVLAQGAADHLGAPPRKVFVPPDCGAVPLEGPARLRQVMQRLRVAQSGGVGGAVLLVDEYTRSIGRSRGRRT